jgi:phosphoribosylcarboxyaminoimidazole (NCAIR) mutase
VVAAHTICRSSASDAELGAERLDSLLSTVQMPKGIPVATVAIGASGAATPCSPSPSSPHHG